VRTAVLQLPQPPHPQDGDAPQPHPVAALLANALRPGAATGPSPAQRARDGLAQRGIAGIDRMGGQRPGTAKGRGMTTNYQEQIEELQDQACELPNGPSKLA